MPSCKHRLPAEVEKGLVGTTGKPMELRTKCDFKKKLGKDCSIKKWTQANWSLLSQGPNKEKQ